MNKNIQLFTPTFHVDECLVEIRECLEVGWTGIGFKTNKFEDAWKDYTKLSHAHFLNSNTAGLHLAVKIFKETYGWKEDDEIITTPMTFVSTNHAIMYENLKPVFADIDETLCLDPKSVESKITKKTKAVIYVGFGGNSGKLDNIKSLCAKHKLKLILDAAHMAGSYYKEQHAGHGVDVSVFSFQAVKNLPTADSGMICYNEEEFDKKVRMYSWLGINKDTYSRTENLTKGNYKWLYDVDYLGYKYNGNSIMAAIGLVELKYLDISNDRRREISSLYEKRLKDNENIRLIPIAEECLSSRHLFQIRVDEKKRDEMILYLNSKGIFPGVHYRTNTDYSMYQYAKGTCPNADAVSKEIITLPIHLRLSDDDINYIADTVIEFLK
jgi:dTDP-4-amino-4,6-dideoxygalactose transaminase